MGRRGTLIKIHGDMLNHLVQLRAGGIRKLSTATGISRQSIHTWIKTENIPPKRLSEIVLAINLSAEDVRALHRVEHVQAEVYKQLHELRMENKKLKRALAVFCEESELSD